MKPLHGCGFDLFGAVYEMFADAKEKKDFGQYFTRRHYTHIFAKLLLRNEKFFNKEKKFTILDPACGTGGFLTEGFKILRNAYAMNGVLTKDAEDFLANDCFWGIDVRSENISRTKLNMFLVGDGHTHMKDFNTLTEWEFELNQKWSYVMTNPPVGAGTIKAECSVVSSNRSEIAFLYKVIKLLEDGGKACILLPDGVLENPVLAKLRKDLLEKCTIEAIVSLPKFAFAPYTKEKMYAVFFTKRNEKLTQIQKNSIWMYIIDNDGLANSDKRFPTKLRNNRNGWAHDEISGWVSTEGEEMVGLLEERWLKYDDSKSGTKWIDEKGEEITLHKAGYIKIADILKSNYCELLPEYYLRNSEPHYITLEELKIEIKEMENLGQKGELKQAIKKRESIRNKLFSHTYTNFQVQNIPINKVIDYISGNSGLTEQFIYQKTQHTGKKYIVLSSSTEEDTKMGEIVKCDLHGKEIKVFENEEGLLVVRNGKAGTTLYLPKGNYTINDHAYILYSKKDCPYKIDLKWLSIQYKQEFLNYASSSDNGTWNMTGFFKNVTIDIPDYKEQTKIVAEYNRLENG